MSNDIIVGKLNLIKKNLLGCELEFGEQKRKGIIFKDDDMTETGIKPRWVKIYAISDELAKEIPVKAGQWVLIEHARWSRGFKLDEGNGPVLVRLLDYNDIWLVTEEKPFDFNTV